MNKIEPVINPTRLERFTLRFMIVFGALCMCFFLVEILQKGTECATLYWMLIVTVLFTCVKIIHEWIHYLFITVPEKPAAEKVFTVDIFTTFCAGEPYEMIRETLIAINAIKYPHTAYLCDEANDSYLKDLCFELGVNHVTRTLKTDAKAGNINNALKVSSGELCLVLDPDHVPLPEFLDPIVAHFNNPEIGFVQVVQSYKNQGDTLVSKGAAQQTYQFYGPIMMTMNRYGTVLAIGANCTFRRTALESIGGHAAGLAEDMHTAMQLHAMGWKSVYVPQVLAKGLVPSTLSAYYSQQLKWSRGVFELLVTSYPKLFGKFRWQHKLHYGTIPIFYFSGIFCLINFIIPSASLLFNTSPINVDFTNFLFVGFPFVASIILIRHYVQKWVMEEEERGFHLVGGLLMIGTWWIYLLGLYYTLLRKKVPYNPTPKDGNEENNWPLNIPNLFIIFVSTLSIVYGLFNDFNPYNLIMAGFSALNCLILLFTVVASRQTQIRKFKSRHALLFAVSQQVALFKARFWKTRRMIYRMVRRWALFITVVVAAITMYSITYTPSNVTVIQSLPDRKNILVAGIFAPAQPTGLSSVNTISKIERHAGIHFGIMSLYLAWGDQKQVQFPTKLIDSIYAANAIPMITWEPWQNLFEKNKTPKFKDEKVFARIVKGEYDDYLHGFCDEIARLHKPVFIRFAHEVDNPQYPWSLSDKNLPDEFVAAWKYVHDYFTHNNANNAIWVWNPWKAETARNYFPGKEYVDWIGVTNLNYGNRNPDKQWYNMQQLYEPFHQLPEFKKGLPVMLAEMGSLRKQSQQKEWFHNAFETLGTQYPEIKAFVLFNTDNDKNTLYDQDTIPLDWTIGNFDTISKLLTTNKKTGNFVSNKSFINNTVANIVDPKNDTRYKTIALIKGVTYSNDQQWQTNYHKLRTGNITSDFRQMKAIGINTVKHFGPNIYDHNILTIAKQEKLSVVYSFWLPDSREFILNKDLINNFAGTVVKTIAKLKNNKNIAMWNIANTPLTQMEQLYLKPDLFYVREQYLAWLNSLVSAIKKEDPQRAISVDIDVDNSLQENAHLYKALIPAINIFGLVADENSNIDQEVGQLQYPYYFSKINTEQYLKVPNNKTGAFISNWQDQHTENFVTFDGLIDIYGNDKLSSYKLSEKWKGIKPPTNIPPLKILRPATTIWEKNIATYHLLYKINNKWQVINNTDGLNFKWHLVKTDGFANPIDIMEIGEGAELSLQIPAQPYRYLLYVYATKGKQVKIIKSILNTHL